MVKHYCEVRATLCSVINARSDLCSGDEQALFGDEDALKVDKKGLKDD